VQFFPDFFDFSALTTRKAIAEAIGNAVPPKMSMVFASALVRMATR
jgi:DNA (cytosine-5)-methyltransferase 1